MQKEDLVEGDLYRFDKRRFNEHEHGSIFVFLKKTPHHFDKSFDIYIFLQIPALKRRSFFNLISFLEPIL